MMKQKTNQTSDLISIRHVPFALICTTAWLLLLIVSDYPASDLGGAAVLAFLVLWMILVIVLNATIVTSDWIRGRVKEIYGSLEVDEPEHAAPGAMVKTIAGLVIAATLLSAIGLSMILTTVFARLVGLPSIDGWLFTAGLATFGLGFVVTTGYYMLTTALMLLIDRQIKQHEEVRVKIRQRVLLTRQRSDFPNQGGALLPRDQRNSQYGTRRALLRLQELNRYHLPLVVRAKS